MNFKCFNDNTQHRTNDKEIVESFVYLLLMAHHRHEMNGTEILYKLHDFKSIFFEI